MIFPGDIGREGLENDDVACALGRVQALRGLAWAADLSGCRPSARGSAKLFGRVLGSAKRPVSGHHLDRLTLDFTSSSPLFSSESSIWDPDRGGRRAPAAASLGPPRPRGGQGVGRMAQPGARAAAGLHATPCPKGLAPHRKAAGGALRLAAAPALLAAAAVAHTGGRAQTAAISYIYRRSIDLNILILNLNINLCD